MEYSAHVQDIGWQKSVKDGALAGTTGKGKRVEAIKINLTGTLSESCDVYYRVHAQDYGWLGWTKNDDTRRYRRTFKKNRRQSRSKLLQREILLRKWAKKHLSKNKNTGINGKVGI